MPRSKGRPTRDESATRRKGSAEQGREEYGLSEEEIVVKPRAPSVARSARGRPSKAQLRPAVAAEEIGDNMAEETQSSMAGRLFEQNPRLVRAMWSIAGAVVAFLCLFAVIVYYAPRTDRNDDRGLLHALAGKDDDRYLSIDDLILWRKKKVPEVQQLGTIDEEAKLLSGIPSLEDSGAWGKNSDCTYPQCPAYVDTVVCGTHQTDSIRLIRSSVPLLLPPWLSTFPATANLTQQVFAALCEAIVDHPWFFLLSVICAAWKVTELLLRIGKIGGAYVLEFADRIARMYDVDDKAAMVIFDDEERKARKEAEEKLLLRMSTIEKED